MQIIYGIVGAGGFATEVAPLVNVGVWDRCDGAPDTEVVFVVENDYRIEHERILGRRVVRMSKFREMGEQRFFNVAIGDARERERIANSLANFATPFAIQAETHVRLEGNEVGEGAIFCNFTHVTSMAKIGRFFHCNAYSYVGHNCRIGDFVTFAPGVKCNGHVVVEDHAYVGTGTVMDGTDKPVVIGRGAIVGAGAVVTESVPPGGRARPIRSMDR